MTLQIYVGTLTIDGDSKDFTVERTDGAPWGPGAVALTVGDYFPYGYTGEATAQLMEHMQVVIRAAGGGARFPAATVAFDTSTGLVTIDFGVAAELVWTDTDLRDLLGFTATLTGSDTYTATNQCRYIWRPSLSFSKYPGNLTRLFGQRSTSTAGTSSDGTPYGNAGTILYEGEYSYQLLESGEVVTDADTVWESYEQFWQDCIHEVVPVRVYPDRSLNASDSYYKCLMTSVDGSPGKLQRGQANPYRADHYGMWGVDFQLRKWV